MQSAADYTPICPKSYNSIGQDKSLYASSALDFLSPLQNDMFAIIFNILAIKFGYVVIDDYLCMRIRDVAQLVAHTSGGREVASSSLVIPTIQSKGKLTAFLFSFEANQRKL